jgi:hypothetical protein
MIEYSNGLVLALDSLLGEFRSSFPSATYPKELLRIPRIWGTYVYGEKSRVQMQ